MSQKKQALRTTNKDRNRVVYFKKDYKLMIHNITLEEEIRSTFYSLQCANYTSIPNAVFNITMNETVDITTIDMTSNEEEKADLQVTLDLSHFAKGIKNDLAIVKFQVAKEKVLAPSSVNFYTQPLANRKGTIEYKFVGYKITEIDQEEFFKHNMRRDEVVKIDKQLAQNPQLKRLIEILDAKDDVIRTLERKIASLIEQTRKLSHTLQRETSEQRKKIKQGLNLNLNINASNNYHMKRLNEKLTEQNTYLHKRIQSLQEQLEDTQKKLIEYKCENNILNIEIGKKSMMDIPQINLNPSKSIIEQNRQMLQKINELEYDQELEKKSKMADSFFMPGDDTSVKSKINTGTGRRPTQAMTISPNNLGQTITPRGNSRGRTKSVIEPGLMSTFQQQLQQSKVLDQDQVMIELNELKDLKENLQNKFLQAVPQQDGTMKYPRLQAAIKSSYRVIERLNEEKLMIQEKLKRRDQQIQYLRRQLQKSKMNFKNFEKQLRQRSSNAKDQFQQRMAAIKLQTEMKMAQMRKQNRFSDYENVMQQEKRQIEVEKMRYENDALREKYEEMMNELRSLQLQKASQVSKYKSTQQAINKEKEMYKSKYYEMQDSFTKQEQELTVTKQKAKLYEVHMVRIQQLQRNQQNLKQKVEKQQKLNQDLKNKCKRYQDKFADIQPKWEMYRQMQNEFQIMKRKNINLTKLNERFQSRMEEMKKFALRLENAYYQKKQKNQNDYEFDEFYKKQMEQRLELTLKKLRQFQRQFYEEQQKELSQSKKELIEFYYKRIVDQNQRIDQNISYSEQEKQNFKNQKEHEINIVKQGKLDQVDKQIKKYQVSLNKLLSTEQYMPKGLNQKVSFLQDKMRKFEVGEFGAGVLSQHSQSMLKNTVDRLNDSVKDKESQITELKKTIGKMSDGSNLLKVNNIQATFANQRKSMIQEMAKSRQIFSRSFQDLKKANAQLLKQKSSLQIQLQNYKFKQEKLILRNTERQRQLQRVSKKSSDDFKRKITELQKALERKSDQNVKNKIEKEEFKENMNNLIGQLNATATLLEKREEDNLNFEAQVEQLRTRIQQYEQAEKSLMDQVKRIKEQAAFNEKQFKSLLQERNQNFLKIQRIKNTEIQKLQKTIAQLQYKLQTQVTEVLHTKRDLQKFQQKYSQIQGQLQETKVSYNVVNENYQKIEEDTVLKIHQLQQNNQMLERNLMDMAQHLKETEMQLHQSKIKEESLQKQLKAISGIRDDLGKQQLEFSKKEKKYEQIIQEQNQKLSSLQRKYVQISQKVYEVERENETLNYKFIDKDSQVQDLRQKLNKKYDQVNELKSQKFDADMKVKQLAVDIEHYEHEKESDHQKIISLEEQLQEVKAKLQRVESQGQQQMYKSKLKPPPRTNIMGNSAASNYDDLGASKMAKSIKPLNETKKSVVLSRKEFRQLQASSQRDQLYIQEAESIRGTQLNTPTDLQVEENGPNRFRIWTVNEADEDLRSPKRGQVVRISGVNVDYSENSNEDANLQSDMSARERDGYKSQTAFRTMLRNKQQDVQESFVADSNLKQAQSYGSNQIVEQYAKEIENLKSQIQKLTQDKEYVEQQNRFLKQKIQALTGNVEESQKKNLLASAFGLTGGLLMRQQGQRSSVESNYENPNIPKIKMKSGSNISPPITSKQAIKIEDSKSFHGSIGNSRKSSLNSPSRSPKLSPRDKYENNRNPNSQVNFARSSVGDVVSSRKQSLEQHLEEQNDKVRELQLALEQVQEQNKQLRAALDDEHTANEKLMEQLQLIQESQQEKHRLVEEKTREIDEVTHYYEQIRQQLQKKIQNLVEQQMEKESQQIKLLKTFESKNEQIQQLVNKIQTLQKQIQSKHNQIARLNQEKEKSYRQYRKYEQESQLQILRLKQQFTSLTQLNKQKQNEVQLIAQDYFQLNNRHKTIEEQLRQHQASIRKKDFRIQELTKLYNEAAQQMKKVEDQKRAMRQQIHQLENDLVSYQSNVTDINKATMMTIKKHEIKLSASEEEKERIKQKLIERQNIIQSLKHQIALYNDQTQKLKELNKQLSLELQRTQKQLKDIMKSYQTQFSDLNLDLKATNQNLQKFKNLINQKDQEISRLTRAMKALQCDTRAAFNSQIQIKQSYQKFKSAKSTQITTLLAQIQVKNDEYQKIKKLYQKETEEFFSKEGDYMKKLNISEQSKKSYKEKLVKYQTVLEELERQLELMSSRPTKEQYDELEFENELYKNRIEQLQQMLREFAPQAQNNHQKFNKSDQALQLQYKKYKLQKERQLDDLSNEIDKYCLKINQLEQTNFMFKKQVQKLRLQIKQILDQNNELQEENYDLKQDLTELKEEVQFYKGKRIQNLSKLLNQTM